MRPNLKRLPLIEAELKKAEREELPATTLAYRVGYASSEPIIELVRNGYLEIVNRQPRAGKMNSLNKTGIAIVRRTNKGMP